MTWIVLLGIAAAALLGAGWVMQQRVAIRPKSKRLMSTPLLLDLIRSPLWWGGIAAMAVGQTLSAWALQLGAVSSVEPLLVISLLFAFLISARAARQRPRWQEVGGSILLCAALAVFLAVADPRADGNTDPGWRLITVATVAASLASVILVLAAKGAAPKAGRKRAPALESVLIAAAAGVMYGLQDAATRGAVVAVNHHDLRYVITTMWPWVLLGAATVGVLLSQGAFRAGRLDYALPPTVAAQPIAGVILGLALLGDQIAVTAPDLAVEVLCLVAMVAGIVLIGRSPALTAEPVD